MILTKYNVFAKGSSILFKDVEIRETRRRERRVRKRKAAESRGSGVEGERFTKRSGFVVLLVL